MIRTYQVVSNTESVISCNKIAARHRYECRSDIRRSEIQRLISTGDSCNRVSENNTTGFNRRTHKIHRVKRIFSQCEVKLS